MEFNDFQVINRYRTADGFNHPIAVWSLSDWAVAMAGECGEACNIVKKITRVEDGLDQGRHDGTTKELRAKLADELADTITYAFLLADRAGINMESAVKNKFNRVSDQFNLLYKI